MPLHVFLSQSLSEITGGLSIWKAAKDGFAMALLGLVFFMVLRAKIYQKAHYLLFVGLAVAYLLLHLLLYAVNQDTSFGVAALASVYNNRLLWFFGIGLSTALLLKGKIDQHQLIKIVLGVSTVVCTLGVIQYFLPKDFLTHFGYSLERGARPAFFIDNKPDLPRIMSTLRDPNSLGAYLLVPITLLSYYWLKLPRRRLLLSGLLLIHGLALLLTFSRSAWLGTIVSDTVLLVMMYGKTYLKFLRRYALFIGPILLIIIFGAFTLRDQYFVQNVIVHSDESTKQTDSNNLHFQLAAEGLKGAISKPLGHGPGTAGIVSIQNKDGGKLTENYYVQIAYEVGFIGLAILLMVHYKIYSSLRGNKSPLGLALLATFWGYVLINMLLHIWSNEAVALQWWLLAGLIMGSKAATAKA